jgi:hypothetical protein
VTLDIFRGKSACTSTNLLQGQRGVQSVSLGYQKHQGTRVSAQENIPLTISKAESAPPLGVV